MHKSLLLLAIPLILSAFTHLWNPVGFPDLFYDEGVYIRRALNILNGLGPQESATYYDHPFFGQFFLAGIFKIIDFPNSLHPSTDINSIKSLYLVPRVLMGLLAIFDTFLIFKISEKRYGKNIAILASILFAVMPLSWFIRRILLDSIMLPFLLSSVLFAVYSKYNVDNTIVGKEKDNILKIHSKKIYFIVISGIFLGLAIFTKIPAFVIIPLVGYLIFTNNNKSWKSLGIWFIPVVLIPLIWPAYSLAVGQFNPWLDGVFNQTQREDKPPLKTINILFKIDPLLFIIGIAGLFFAIVKRDMFILLWAIPNVLFHYLIGYYPDREFIPLLPIFCIAAAVLIGNIIVRIKSKHEKKLQFATISIIGIFGLLSTTLLITTNLTTSQFETAAFVSTYLENNANKKEGITLITNPIYSWIFSYVYQEDNVLSGYRDIIYQRLKTDKVLLIADQHFNYGKANEKLGSLYNSTSSIAGFSGNRDIFDTRDYPYTSMILNNEGLRQIEIRTNSESKLSITPSCVEYDLSMISVSCKSADLTYVSNELNNTNVLHKVSPKTWILNANLTIENDSNFYINSSDTDWLKINSTAGLTHFIKVQGNLIVDSVKITGWDTLKNNYAKIDQNGTIPRSYMIVNDGMGTTNITNSEIAYLGYNHGKSFGLTYQSGIGSLIKNNKIHDLWYGFNSQGNVYDVTIESNYFYNNNLYGIYLHDGTHDININNNTVYNNGKHGIICSTNCNDIILENNKVFNNAKEGILFSKNVSNSHIRNNIVYNNTDQIAIYDLSNNNQIYDNNMTGGKVGIRVNTQSAYNHLYNNSIINSGYGVYFLRGASNNTIETNKIVNSSNTALYVKDNNTNGNVFKNNYLVDNRKNEINRNMMNNNNTLFINNRIENTR